MRVRINPDKNFDAIFGADCFRQHWPELETKQGVLVKKLGGSWYIWDTATDWVAHETSFFTWNDIQIGLTIVRERDARGRFVKEIGDSQ